MDGWITLNEAAEIAGVSKSTIEGWMKKRLFTWMKNARDPDRREIIEAVAGLDENASPAKDVAQETYLPTESAN